jgi:hypothetical protein
MSIRLREIDGELCALCAAFSDAKEGDVYLDDAQHYALVCKFMRDGEEVESDEVNNALARKECRCPSCHPPVSE